MTKGASAVLVILIVLILIFLSLAGGGFYLLQKERAKTVELQAQIEEVNTKQRITETKLEESKKLVTEMQFKLEESRSQIAVLNTNLGAEKIAKEEAQNRIGQLRTDLDEQKNLRSDLEKKLNQAQDEARKAQAWLKELQSQKTTLESEKAALEAKLKDIETKSDVELGRIVVTPETSMAGAPVPIAKQEKSVSGAALEGKVMVVNKDYTFAVINLGSKDGIALGQVFSVYHNNKYVGVIKIEKVHESMAAAGFESPDL
ncbi:MAG: hypothetical protein NT066_00805 [Candidatus Omnitrophica bacterium]|nr:hypothetical protein [Candidatus Omnitrophota bacterium]